MSTEQYIYMAHHFMLSEIHENVSKYPENLYSIESLDQELSMPCRTSPESNYNALEVLQTMHSRAKMSQIQSFSCTGSLCIYKGIDPFWLCYAWSKAPPGRCSWTPDSSGTALKSFWSKLSIEYSFSGYLETFSWITEDMKWCAIYKY